MVRGRGWWESRVLVGYSRGGCVGGLELGVYRLDFLWRFKVFSGGLRKTEAQSADRAVTMTYARLLIYRLPALGTILWRCWNV